MEAGKLREILSFNIKRERKRLGLTQEKLAEYAELSAQTINDIEGCRMWVSDKTITKLAGILRVEVYQLLLPALSGETQETETQAICRNDLLFALEDRIIKNIRQQFRETIEQAEYASPKE